MKSPFPAGWWSFDLGRYRPCDGTYSALYIRERAAARRIAAHGGVPQLHDGGGQAADSDRALAKLVKAAGKAGVRLPAAFLTFMGDVSLQNEVPSCTACEWDLSAAPVPCKVVPGAFTVRFLRDQQDCLFWYLHVLPDGDAHVLCSPIPFDDPAVVEKITPEVVIANTWYCAPHFEHFVYRFWIENVLWGLVNRPDSVLNDAQCAYVLHYEAAAATAAAAKRQADATAEAAAKQADATTESKKAATKAGSDGGAKRGTAKRAGAEKGAEKAAAKRTAVGKGAKKAAAERTAAGKGAKTAAAKRAAKRAAAGKGAKKAAAKRAGAGKGAKKAAAKRAAAGKGAKKAAAKRAGAGKGAKKAAAKRAGANKAAAKRGARRGSTMKAAKRSTAKKVTKVVS
jgi:hypothetical protein